MPTHASGAGGPTRMTKPVARDEPPSHSVENLHGSTHVNVAFPFSKINVQDPSSELRELATLVADLITVLEATSGGQLKDLRERSQELADRLG